MQKCFLSPSLPHTNTYTDTQSLQCLQGNLGFRMNLWEQLNYISLCKYPSHMAVSSVC